LWTFDEGLQGWGHGNWESVAVRGGAIQGVSKYDCQLLSPKLDIEAKDYPELVVRVRSDRYGRGETFFNNPAEAMSDAKKAQHALVGGDGYRLYRVALAEVDEWKGTIERIRFDPLNPAGVKLSVDFIALMPEAGVMLINGGAEIVSQGMPFEWQGGPDGERAKTTGEGVFRGKRALRMVDNGWWEPPPIDLSFLGEFRVCGQVRGSESCVVQVTIGFLDLDGVQLSSTAREVPAAPQAWRPFEINFDAPRRAASALVRFTAPAGSVVADLDEVQIVQVKRGHIRSLPPPQPNWDAEWIWHPNAMERDDVHAYFRHRFELPDREIASARIQITVDDAYALSLNGREVHRTFGETDGWRSPEVLDLKAMLKPGDNVIEIDAVDVQSAQGLIAEGVVCFADGRELPLCTNASWVTAVAADGPWVSAKAIGRPPCRPWGSLPYVSLGKPTPVRVRSIDVPRALTVPGELSVAVELAAESDVSRPVYVEVIVERKGKIVCREWAPELAFAAEAKKGQTHHVRWRVALPYGVAGGPMTVRVELTNATGVGPGPRSTFEAHSRSRSEGFAKAEVRMVGGLPCVFVNGVEIDPTQALFIRPDALQQRNAADAGMPIWSIALGDMGFKKDGSDYIEIDRTISRYLEAKPDVWLLPTFTLDTRNQTWWIREHPEARCRLEGGGDVIGDYHGSRRMVPSFASPVWRRDYGEAMRHLIRHLKESPFASRIIGFQPCSGITWEWFLWGAQSAELVDYCDAAATDFRRWLTDKYATDGALRAAWHNPLAKLLTAPVPTNARRRKPEYGMFYDPATQQDVLDYHRYQHDLVVDSILHFARIIKEETDGRSLCGTYYGYTTHLPESPGFCQSSGHFALHRLLESDAIDYLMSPVAYAWREVGGTAACMTTTGSFPANGKLWWNQADLRSHWADQTGFGRPADLKGSVQCMRREVARSLAQGSAVQWYDFSVGWTLGDDRLANEAKRLLAVSRERRSAEDWPRSDYLAVIVDETQMGTFDLFRPAYGLHLIYHQRERLSRAGVPWRAYLLSDLMRHPELLEHRAFLMLNLFRLDRAQREFLRERLMSDGRTVAFVGPVGLMNEEGFSQSYTKEVLGWGTIRVRDATSLRARLLRRLPKPWSPCSGMEFGTGTKYAPICLPAGGRGQVLGTMVDSSLPGVMFERRKGYSIFWSVAPDLPSGVIRALCDCAGVPVLTRSDAAIFAGHGFVGVHVRSAGTYRVDLPRPRAVRELIYGRRWPAATRHVELDLKAGDTAMLLCTR